MTTPQRNWPHDIPQIKEALQIALHLATHYGSKKETGAVEYAIRRINDWHIPTGVTVDGKEVSQESQFSDDAVKDMKKWGTQ